MSEVFHSIKAVAQQTGLSSHVIRVWEKRYGAVRPVRTDSNRRVYSSEEVGRLNLLRQATQLGHSIGNIARLSSESLAALVENQPQQQTSSPSAKSRAFNPPPKSSESVTSTSHLVEKCLGHIRDLDHQALEETLNDAMVSMGHQGLLQGLVSPLTCAIGEEWKNGTLKVAHEHFASATIRAFLWNASRPFAASDSAPNLIVATPAGQHHEIGAVMVAAVARNQGWRVAYLGTCLPATEIAGAAIQNQSKAVLLSIVYPEDDADLPSELRTLRKLLPKDIQLLVGGRASNGYGGVLREINAVMIPDLQALYPALDSVRSRSR